LSGVFGSFFRAPFQSNAKVFYGQCSELCGSNHGFMPICVEAVQAVITLMGKYQISRYVTGQLLLILSSWTFDRKGFKKQHFESRGLKISLSL
jgi:hypothetical protein